MIDIQRYAGRQANVNSYLLSDAENVIVVDLLSPIKKLSLPVSIG